MLRVPLSARVSADLDSSARARATDEGVSLSAIVERALAAYLKAGSESEDKPAWAIAIEARLSQVEAQQQQAQSQGNRKGKRR